MFARRQERSWHCLQKFQKVRFEVHKKFMNFVRIFTVCYAYLVNDDCIVLLKGN